MGLGCTGSVLCGAFGADYGDEAIIEYVHSILQNVLCFDAWNRFFTIWRQPETDQQSSVTKRYESYTSRRIPRALVARFLLSKDHSTCCCASLLLRQAQVS